MNNEFIPPVGKADAVVVQTPLQLGVDPLLKKIIDSVSALQELREEVVQSIFAAIDQIRHEDNERKTRSDWKVEQLELLLKDLGVYLGAETVSYALTNNCMQYLKQRPGVRVKASELTQAMKTTASIAVALRKCIEQGLVEATGEYRGRSYRYIGCAA